MAQKASFHFCCFRLRDCNYNRKNHIHFGILSRLFKIFEKLVRGMLILEQRWKEHFPALLPQCWQQQSRKVNMSQLLQSVFPPQSIWITVNKTWNAFKNSIAKSLVSTWSLFILKKRADLEEMAFSSMNSLFRRPLRQFYFKHNTAYENETWSDLNRRIKVFFKVNFSGSNSTDIHKFQVRSMKLMFYCCNL